jgi:shikimate dehydrogenase
VTLDELVSGHTTVDHFFVSLAARPGKFGTTVHNAAFGFLKMPYRYVALVSDDIRADIGLIRKADIPGAAITMPHKMKVMEYLDECSADASDIGSVNTVVNRGGKLVGHNTDLEGVRKAVSGVRDGERAVILGTGGMARAFGFALGNAAIMLGRSELYRRIEEATVLVNATPMGMPGVESLPDLLDRFPRCRLYIESVVNTTPTERHARQRGIEVVTGLEITFHQAFEQFRLFTGIEAPRDIMRSSFS